MRTRIARTIALLMAVALGAVTTVAQGQREGIKVHGHWTIDIRQPDGTPVAHHDFENALDANSGANALVSLVYGQSYARNWDVNLKGTPGPCAEGSGQARECIIFEKDQLTDDTNLFQYADSAAGRCQHGAQRHRNGGKSQLDHER